VVNWNNRIFSKTGQCVLSISMIITVTSYVISYNKVPRRTSWMSEINYNKFKVYIPGHGV
jgi:hypothetical protein